MEVLVVVADGDIRYSLRCFRHYKSIKNLLKFLFTKRLFLDIKQTSSLLLKWQFRDEVWYFSEKIRISTFSARNLR